SKNAPWSPVEQVQNGRSEPLSSSGACSSHSRSRRSHSSTGWVFLTMNRGIRITSLLARGRQFGYGDARRPGRGLQAPLDGGFGPVGAERSRVDRIAKVPAQGRVSLLGPVDGCADPPGHRLAGPFGGIAG